MKMLLILLTLTSINAFAGNGGGTMIYRHGTDFKESIIYKIGQKNDDVIFASGKLRPDKKWAIEKVKISNDLVQTLPELKVALDESELKKDWVLTK